MSAYYATVGKTIEEVLQDEYGLEWVKAQEVGKWFNNLLLKTIDSVRKERDDMTPKYKINDKIYIPSWNGKEPSDILERIVVSITLYEDEVVYGTDYNSFNETEVYGSIEEAKAAMIAEAKEWHEGLVKKIKALGRGKESE